MRYSVTKNLKYVYIHSDKPNNTSANKEVRLAIKKWQYWYD